MSTKNGTLINNRVVDESDYWSTEFLSMVDLNGDGKKELLFRLLDFDKSKEGVFALPIPDDIMKGTFGKFMLANFDDSD